MTPYILEVPTFRGSMPVHVTEPGRGEDAPLVVLYMDAPGVREALHGYARSLAEAGYRVALPDLYYALSPDELPRPERLSRGDESEFARMGAAVAQLRDSEVLEDTAAMLEALDARPAPWGCVGFCAGGRFGLRAAARFGSELSAAALLHPSRLVTDESDSPHHGLDGARGAMYLAFGERDHVTPLSVIPPLREELERHGIPHEIEVIPEADHGFTMPGLPAYHPAAAQRAWHGTIGLLERALGSKA